METLENAKSEPTGGKWLERLTAQMAPYIKEWDISHCWIWSEWPDRERLLPDTTNQDNGIDAVAISSSTGAYIAIQCKSRQLDENGRGNDIERPEITSFISESDNDLYDQRWLITNGDSRLNDRAERTNSQLKRRLSFSTFTPISRHRRKEASKTRSAPTANPILTASGASSPRPACRTTPSAPL